MELQRNILESSNTKFRSLLCFHTEDTSKVLFWFLVYFQRNSTWHFFSKYMVEVYYPSTLFSDIGNVNVI